jgi:hypothetical protein
MPQVKKLKVDVRIIQNPWLHSVPTKVLGEILMRIAALTAERIRTRKEQGIYEESRLAIALLDPTAPMSRPSEQCVLAIILIGDDAEEFITFALDKAFEHRDHGMNNGAAIAAHKQVLPDGATRWGHSACVDDTTFVGASAQLSIVDRLEATVFGAEFNCEIHRTREEWEKDHPGGDWYCDQGIASERVREAAVLTGIWQGSTTTIPAS